MLGLLGKKLGMTQVFLEDGSAIPVTIILAGPCDVVQVKTEESDSYSAIQLGYENKKDSLVNKPDSGHFKRASVKAKKHLREIRLTSEEVKNYKNGDTLDVSVFKAGDFVDVEGVSKGRGFAGVMKRHNFSGFPATHGTHEYFRHGGSIGCRTSPGRVFKGKKMAGHMGNARVTVQNLEIIKIIPDDNFILVKGAIPGPRTGLVMIKKAVKKAA